MILLRLLFFICYTKATFLFFENDSYEFYVSESTSIHTRIGLIKATSSSSLTIEYKLYGNTNRTFYLNPTTGELFLSNFLDYETLAIHKLTIEAHTLTAIAPCFSELTIYVVNTNDNFPEINLIFYPSVLIGTDLIKYDVNSYSTPLATINVKDRDESTTNLGLFLNDTDHFQIQFVRQIKNGLVTESIYILATKNNSNLIEQDFYYLSLNACDNDQPSLWTNQSYKFHMKSNDDLCQFSFDENNYSLDIEDNVTNHTLILHPVTNKFCQNIYYSIDDKKNFYVNPNTGDLYTAVNFDRNKQSIYQLKLKAINRIEKQIQANITVRILNRHGHVPFLRKKYLKIDRNDFISINLYTLSNCHYQPIVNNYFQLLPNCTLIKFQTPFEGKYLFNIELDEFSQYKDTFVLELIAKQNQEIMYRFIRSQWLIIIPITLAIIFILIIIICSMILIARRKCNQVCHTKQKLPSLSLSSSSDIDGNTQNKYDAILNQSQLKVHDDHELSPSPTTTATAIYLIQKSLSSSPTRDDEGYSGSSDVSDNHLSIESTIIAANQLFEQYRIHEFRTRQSASSLSPYDVPKSTNPSILPTDVSFV